MTEVPSLRPEHLVVGELYLIAGQLAVLDSMVLENGPAYACFVDEKLVRMWELWFEDAMNYSQPGWHPNADDEPPDSAAISLQHSDPITHVHLIQDELSRQQ